jgi:predicted RNase H-like nuclease (RuvC/YqgF family)
MSVADKNNGGDVWSQDAEDDLTRRKKTVEKWDTYVKQLKEELEKVKTEVADLREWGLKDKLEKVKTEEVELRETLRKVYVLNQQYVNTQEAELSEKFETSCCLKSNPLYSASTLDKSQDRDLSQKDRCDGEGPSLGQLSSPKKQIIARSLRK